MKFLDIKKRLDPFPKVVIRPKAPGDLIMTSSGVVVEPGRKVA